MHDDDDDGILRSVMHLYLAGKVDVKSKAWNTGERTQVVVLDVIVQLISRRHRRNQSTHVDLESESWSTENQLAR